MVANTQNVAVIGHPCSESFANVTDYPACDSGGTSALAIYELAGVVTINGSTSSDCLPAVGPTVFNATVVSNAAGLDDWYSAVQALPSDIAWNQAYTTRFGTPNPYLGDTYYDAARLLLQRLTKASKIKNGNLQISRPALADAIRNTSNYCGVTGRVVLDPDGFRNSTVTACVG